MEKQLHSDDTWWKGGVVYQIYPRSFYDANGDGIGDLEGIRLKLDYLSRLRVDALWLSPINSSPMYDFGYDISDYRGIDPVFGDTDLFRDLLHEAHERGIAVLMDMVLNHSSHLHSWFRSSRASREGPFHDYYIWRDAAPGGGPPNNWLAAFGGRAWTYDDERGQYYLHSFLAEQPDLNWSSEGCRAAILDEVEYWLKMGVDGFRLDVINLIGKDLQLRSNPWKFGWPPRPYELQRHQYDRNSPETHEYLREFRRLLERYPGTVSVGEIYLDDDVDHETAASFTGRGDELHLAFDFAFTKVRWSARRFAALLSGQHRAALRYGKAPCFVFSNHDVVRAVSRFCRKRDTEETKERLAKLLGLILLTQPGTVFLYMGEELGMEDARLSRKQRQDPVGIRYWPFHPGRDGQRLPMQWAGRKNGGFSSNPDAKPWLPLHPRYQEQHVQEQEDREDSPLRFYRSLMALRREYTLFRDGAFRLISRGEGGLLAYRIDHREDGGSSLFVYANFFRKAVPFFPEPGARTLLSTGPINGEAGLLAPLEARILEKSPL